MSFFKEVAGHPCHLHICVDRKELQHASMAEEVFNKKEKVFRKKISNTYSV